MQFERSYHEKRLAKARFRHQLKARTRAVAACLESYGVPRNGKRCILDVGTADGMMLDSLRQEFDANFIGFDLSFELLSCHTKNSTMFVNGDFSTPPFKDGTFDVIIATAVIEHVASPLEFLKTCLQLLKKNGIVLITTPVPFYDYIAMLLTFEAWDEHLHHLSIKNLSKMLRQTGFGDIAGHKFMIFPYDLPFENQIEHFLKRFSLAFLLMNQIVVGKKI